MFTRHDVWSMITKNGDDIVIATHSAPDGDALGSAFALAAALELAGKRPVVALDKYSEKFNFLDGRRFVHDGETSDLPCDVLITVDCGSKERVSGVCGLFEKAKTTVNIDHHINNTNFARHNYVDGGASSTCEMIFDIINMYVPINKTIAEALYMGILTDTGGLRFASTSLHTMEVVMMLMRTGVDFTDIQRRVIYGRSKAEVSIFAKALQNIQFLDDYPIAYTSITQDELKQAGANYTDLDGISQYLLNIEGMTAGVLFVQRVSGQIRASMRSNASDVGEIALKLGGGGHKFAAAALLEPGVGMDEAITQVLTALKAAFDKL